ncbi:MAG TPA: DUF357 domain-containing protein [Candidatus Thermoplasmatota archaeon]|nr:DUF357 domain-containing protein [Candidatus Thermoplasmatota archaeon]
MKELTDEKIARYLDVTARALAKLRVVPPSPSHLRDVADDFLKMATSYHADAKHFAAKGDHVNAFACVNYAHGWIDAGARLGLWDVGGDDVLFTLQR